MDTSFIAQTRESEKLLKLGFIINPNTHDSNEVHIHEQISDELLFQLQIAGENVAVLVTYDIGVGVWNLDGGFFNEREREREGQRRGSKKVRGVT
jgi:hypothetical protein